MGAAAADEHEAHVFGGLTDQNGEYGGKDAMPVAIGVRGGIAEVGEADQDEHAWIMV